MTEHHPWDVNFGELLPEQTLDDVERDDVAGAAPDDDLKRFLDDKPPHHLD